MVHLGNEKLRIGRFRGAATSQLHDDSEGPAGHANKFPATGPKTGQDQIGHPGAYLLNAFPVFKLFFALDVPRALASSAAPPLFPEKVASYRTPNHHQDEMQSLTNYGESAWVALLRLRCQQCVENPIFPESFWVWLALPAEGTIRSQILMNARNFPIICIIIVNFLASGTMRLPR